MMMTSVRVLALSDQAKDGLLFDGILNAVEVVEEPLAVAVIRALRARDVELRDGDCLFFPDAAPRNRVAEIMGDGVSRIHGWEVPLSDAR